MAANKQPDRSESLMLAAATAVAGTLFLLDQLGLLVHGADILLLHRVMHFAPVLLVLVAVTLILVAGQGTLVDHGQANSSTGGKGNHEN